MKAILTVVFLFITCGTVFSQTETAKIWTRTYDSGLRDVIVKSAADHKGNVYIAGVRSITGAETDTSARMTLVKYSPAGERLWERVFQSRMGKRTIPFGFTLDESGNIYICGTADTLNTNYRRGVIVKYSPEGDTLWSKYYGVNLFIWRHVDIKVDNAGGVYTATDLTTTGGPSPGTSCYLIKYDTTGNFQWASMNYGNAPGPKIEINSAGDIFFAYPKTQDCFITKFDNTGSTQWTTSYNNPSSLADYLTSIKSDPVTGDVIITGYASFSPSDPMEIQTIKFTSGIGAVAWVKRFTGTTISSRNTPLDMAVSPSGDVYICGEMTNNVTGRDAFIIRYNGISGGERYRKVYTHSGGATMEGMSSVSVTSDEQPVVIGYRAAAKDIFVHKYSTNGGILWKYEYNDSLNVFDDASSHVMQGAAGEIYSVANYYNPSAADINVTKFNNVNVTHTTLCKSPRKQTIPGDYIYDTINVNTGSTNLTRLEVVIDSLPHPDPRNLIIKLIGPSGTAIELSRNSGTGMPSTGMFGTIFSDSASKTIDSGSAAYTGYFTPKKPLEVFNSFSPDGNWILSVYNMSTGDSGIVKKWCLKMTYDATVGIHTINNETPAGYELSQNYPNPFNPVTNIKFSLPKSGNVSLKVYDMLGKQVAELVNGYKPAGSYIADFNASHLSSGIYFYRLETDNFSEVKRMALIK